MDDSLDTFPPGTHFNRNTGRPIRRNAGRARNMAGYVDSAIIEEDEPVELPTEDEDGILIKPKRKRKRAKSSSPEPPPIEPILYDEDPDGVSDDDVGMFHHNTPQAPFILQFNIPLGFHGPLSVKLDRKVLEQMTVGAAHTLRPRAAATIPQASTPRVGPIRVQARHTGFLHLPPELRNKVYRHLFVSGQKILFGTNSGCARSAQFLRTCKTVHGEGCSILYGENAFCFDRNRSTRALFWEPVRKEIGYKDVRMFLKMIGPENLHYLREVEIDFEDANPSTTPYVKSNEERRYVNDDHLINCLRILRNARLRKLTIGFMGRRALYRTDVKFLGYLEQIKADEVKTIQHSWWYSANKIDQRAWESLKEMMTRKKKLYVKE